MTRPTAPAIASDRGQGRFVKLQAEWADLALESLPCVCAVRAEQQARREEKRSGAREINLG